VLDKLDEGVSLRGEPIRVLTDLLCELTTLPPVVVIICILASSRPVTKAVAEKADLTGKSRWIRAGRIEKTGRYDGVGEGDATVSAAAVKRV